MNFRSVFHKIGGIKLVSTDSHIAQNNKPYNMSDDYYCEGCMEDVSEETIFDRKSKLWLCNKCREENKNEKNG